MKPCGNVGYAGSNTKSMEIRCSKKQFNQFLDVVCDIHLMVQSYGEDGQVWEHETLTKLQYLLYWSEEVLRRL